MHIDVHSRVFLHLQICDSAIHRATANLRSNFETCTPLICSTGGSMGHLPMIVTFRNVITW